jgi:membrane protease subunit HflK
MPWKNDGGGNRGGPWGQGPQGPPGGGRGGGGGPRPPDIEEIFNRIKDTLKGVGPGGGGGGTQTPTMGGPRFAYWPIVLLALVVYWGLHAVFTVQADEQGVVMRFGKYNRTVDPGLHFIAWPFETVERPRARAEFIQTFGFGGEGSTPNEGLMLTSDQNIVDIEFTVLWRIANPREYLFNVRSPEQLLRVVAESAMREYTGRTRADDIRTKGREALQAAVQKQIQDIMNSYKAGVLITGVQLNKAEPPEPVLDAFAEVNRAQQDSVKMVNEANQYAFQRNGAAKGEAAQIRQAADAYKGRVVAEAEGEAQRFLSVYEQYKNAKDVTRQRLFIETMEQVLSGSRKIVIEEGAGSGVVPYLPLPSLDQQRKAQP